MKYIDDFIRYLRVVKKDSDYTLVNYREDLMELYDFNTDLLNIDEGYVSEYLEYLYAKGLSRNSISRKLSAIRSFYNYLVREDIVEVNYFKDIANPKRARSLPKYARDNDLEVMFNSFDLSLELEQRNRLILELLYATGVRVSELVGIKLLDIDKNNNSIKILGKGRKERIVFFGSYARDILDLYLKDGRRKILKGYQSDYLFLNKNGKKLSARYVRVIINKVVSRCGIEYHISPHTLRHTFATDMLNAGADLMSVKELLGHSSLNTTSIYTHVSQDKLKDIYDMAHPRADDEEGL